MNTRALFRGISGKSLLAFAGIVLLLGLVTGEAAAATVSGLVTNVTSRDPGPGVPNLFVVATTPAPNFTFLAEAQTGTDGKYTISLPTYMVGGTQFLVFVDLHGTGLVSALTDTVEKTVTLPLDGSNVYGIDFTLVDGVKLSGAVTVQSTGKGASGVIVFATNPSMGYKFLGQATTDVNGAYGLLVPPNETEGVGAELAVDTQGKFPGTVVYPAFIDVKIGTDPISSGLDFLLKLGVTVQGWVTDGFYPISPALVEAFHVETTGRWVWLDDDTTEVDGFYSVAVDASLGKILLRVTASGFVEKRVDVTWDTSNPPKTKDRDVVLSKSVQISGTVTDASNNGNPIVGVPVEAYFGDLIFGYPEVTNDSGVYTLDVDPNLGQGTIHVDVAAFYEATKSNYLQPPDQQVSVGIDDITGINFALTPAVMITGKVTDASTSQPVAIGGARVTAYFLGVVQASALTDTTGLYTLKVAKNLSPDVKSVDVHVEATSYQSQDQYVAVGPSDITGIDFPLKKAIDTVKITSATWCKSKNQLTVFATSTLQPNPTLTATVKDKYGNTVLTKAMTFSNKRGQYELRVRIKTDLGEGSVRVTSSKGGSDSATIVGSCQ